MGGSTFILLRVGKKAKIVGLLPLLGSKYTVVWPQERNFAAILGGAAASKHYLNRSNWQSLLRKSLGCVVLHSDSKISFQNYGETVIL